MTTLTPDLLQVLRSPAGETLLADLASADLSESNTLRLITQLRRTHPADLAASALETARLRIRAQEKFGDGAARLFLTRDALEQATDLRVSRYRFGDNPLFADQQGLYADLGCGIGGDALSLSEVGTVIGCDLDPLRLAIASANVPAARFIQADLTQPLPFDMTRISAAFFDPARRADGKRLFSIHDYLPPLRIIEGWSFPVMVKLSPGVDLSELDWFTGQIEFISLDGDLKECVISRGDVQQRKVATLIARDGSYQQMRRLESETEPKIDVSAPRGFLYEPDAAVIRAGLVQDLGAQIGATLIDESIAFLSSDAATETLFARCWAIEDWMPFNLKKLKAWLRERNIGRVTVKKRGSPILPEELIAKLKLPGTGGERVIVLTHVQGNPAILICLPPHVLTI